MAKTPLEKQIEKARKEAKKVEQQEATRQRAATIISNQPIINGLRIVDDTAETVLNCLIDNCNNASSGYVNYDSDMFPRTRGLTLPQTKRLKLLFFLLFLNDLK